MLASYIQALSLPFINNDSLIVYSKWSKIQIFINSWVFFFFLFLYRMFLGGKISQSFLPVWPDLLVSGHCVSAQWKNGLGWTPTPTPSAALIHWSQIVWDIKYDNHANRPVNWLGPIPATITMGRLHRGSHQSVISSVARRWHSKGN